MAVNEFESLEFQGRQIFSGFGDEFLQKKGTRFEKEAKRNKEMGYSDLYNIQAKRKEKNPVRAIKRLHYLNGISTSASLVMMPCGGFSWIVFS